MAIHILLFNNDIVELMEVAVWVVLGLEAGGVVDVDIDGAVCLAVGSLVADPSRRQFAAPPH